MPKVKLDAHVCLIATCRPGRKRDDLFDTGTIGFVLECQSSGTKTYAFRYQDQYGKLKQRRISPYGAISFAEAQKIARKWRAEVIMGGDPAAQKAEKKAILTYNEIADEHLAYVKTYARRPADTEGIMRVHLRPKWGCKRLDEITTPNVAKWLGELRQTALAPATVEKIRVTFHRSFELALRWQTPGIKSNPVRGIQRPKIENARDRFLTSEEAARLLKAADASLNKQLGNIVRLLLFSGCRKRELLDARWEHLDTDRRAWFIPTSKTGKSRYVPLSQAALDVIDKLPRFKDCPWLLPNPETRKPYTDIKHPWETARAAAGLGDLRIHDLRHSAASFMINAGIDLFAVGKVLGHADHQSTMRYAHLDNRTLLAAVEAGAAKMHL
jgi:integrase